VGDVNIYELYIFNLCMSTYTNICIFIYSAPRYHCGVGDVNVYDYIYVFLFNVCKLTYTYTCIFFYSAPRYIYTYRSVYLYVYVYVYCWSESFSDIFMYMYMYIVEASSFPIEPNAPGKAL